MLESVSGWSGPSFNFRRARVCSRSVSARSFWPAGVAGSEVVHARERLGVVRAEPCGERGTGLVEKRDRPIRVAQIELGKAQGHLHPGHGEGVAGGFPFDLGRRTVEPLAQDRRQRLATLLRVLGVEILEDRTQYFIHLRDLGQPLLGLTTLPPRLEESQGRADDAEHQRQQQQRRRRHLGSVAADELAAGGRRPSAGRPRPPRGSSTAPGRRPGRPPRRTAARAPSPAPSSRSSPARPGRAATAAPARHAGWPPATAAPPTC